jgi:hypothetical protein
VPSHDPAALAPDAQLRELARLLAVGLMRLRRPVIPAETPPTSATQKSLESTPNHLAVAGQQSVTVHAG